MMACNCKHNRENIEQDRRAIERFKKHFVKRMTVDSKHNDRRRKDFNQAIFSNAPFFSLVDLEMVMDCFESAVKDHIRSYCDVDNCNGNRRPKEDKK